MDSLRIGVDGVETVFGHGDCSIPWMDGKRETWVLWSALGDVSHRQFRPHTCRFKVKDKFHMITNSLQKAESKAVTLGCANPEFKKLWFVALCLLGHFLKNFIQS